MTNTNAAPTVDDVGTARAACDDAEAALARSRGELIAAVRTFSSLPAPIHRARLRLDDAEGAAEAARAALIAARSREAEDPETGVERSHRARVSALIAAHVMGAELVPGHSDVYRWRIRGTDGKVREVPNFTGDAGAIGRAEAMLAENLRGNYARAVVALITGKNSGGFGMPALSTEEATAFLYASPYIRALALLETVHVKPTDNPEDV